MKLKNFTVFFILNFFLVIFLFSCNSKAVTKSNDEILIGEYSPLTGSIATYGKSVHQGIVLAVEEINEKGGVLGKQIKLVTEDTNSRTEDAVNAVTKLINRDKAVAIIGEVTSSSSLAAAPICQSQRVPMITACSTNPEVTKVGDYIFRICFIDPYQGEVLAKFVYNSLKLKNAAILKDIKSDYSIGLAESFENVFTSLGGKIVAKQSYSAGDVDFKAQLTNLKKINPDVILVPGYYTEVGLIIREARNLNMNQVFVGGDGWDSPKLIEIAGKGLNGCYYSNHFSVDNKDPKIQNFVQNFKKKYHVQPDALAALSYDAVYILCDAIKTADTSADRGSIKNELSKIKDFKGVTGLITIDKNRNVKKSAIIFEFINSKPTYKETINP